MLHMLSYFQRKSTTNTMHNNSLIVDQSVGTKFIRSSQRNNEMVNYFFVNLAISPELHDNIVEPQNWLPVPQSLK